jgi:predicted transcriptional regulator
MELRRLRRKDDGSRMSSLEQVLGTVAPKSRSPRRAVLDLAPLELDCMNTLWPVGEATVREIRDLLASRRARAYTTIMTIMDRLARKGVVERRKAGRAYVYRAKLSAEDARAQALAQVVENFFGGSKAALLAELDTAAIDIAKPDAQVAAIESQQASESRIA